MARVTPLHRLQLRCKGGFPGPDEVEVKDVEAQAHRAINDDCLLGVFARLDIQRDDEHLSLRLWCPTSKPIFNLPSTSYPVTPKMNKATFNQPEAIAPLVPTLQLRAL